MDTVHLGKPGRAQKEKLKLNGGLPAKRARKSKPAEIKVDRSEHIVPDDAAPQNIESETNQPHEGMVGDDANIHELQQQQQQSQFDQVVANPRLIQQGTVTTQSTIQVALPNPFGEFFYAI